MATIINNPSDNNGNNSAIGLVIGVIMTLLLIGLFVVYVLPGLRNNGEKNGTNTEIKVQLPSSPNSQSAPTY